MAKILDDQVQAFLLRSIKQRTPYLFVDASYYKIRDGARYVTKVVSVVAGVREDRYREILDTRVPDYENEVFWSGFFEDLKERGLAWVQLIISDGHTGIQKAASAAFLSASWQKCSVHYPGSTEKISPENTRKRLQRV